MTNVVREQAVFSQCGRRTDTTIVAGLPLIASSATHRTCRLCLQPEFCPWPGRRAVTPAAVRTVILNRADQRLRRASFLTDPIEVLGDLTEREVTMSAQLDDVGFERTTKVKVFPMLPDGPPPGADP
ncbi:hypothetical protein ACIP79_02875 [Streptomyces sp. NPDC088747]|uniref:hypothetical protein n=1 Tax=Streptomyces sp. NPDC088747 TaxID=3365886 RepID=UPI0037FB0A0A